jgi:hypothetical protein
MSTRKPFWISQKHTFDKFVLFPTPLTPTKAMLYGIRCCVEGRGDESLVLIDSNRSVEVFGVRMRVKEVDRARRTAVFVARRPGSNDDWIIVMKSHTLKAANFLPNKTFPNTLTHFVRDLFCNILLHEMLFHPLQDRFQVLRGENF